MNPRNNNNNNNIDDDDDDNAKKTVLKFSIQPSNFSVESIQYDESVSQSAMFIRDN